MKTAGLLLIALITLTACRDDDGAEMAPAPTGVVGSWALTEILADPGDGSGVFVPVQSDKYMAFAADGTLSSNGALCSMDGASDTPEQGTYSIADSTITAPSCNDFQWSVIFEVSGNELILFYPCIEPCQAKYTRIQEAG